MVTAGELSVHLSQWLGCPVTIRTQRLSFKPQKSLYLRGISIRNSARGKPAVWLTIENLTNVPVIEAETVTSVDVNQGNLEIKWISSPNNESTLTITP